MKADGIKDEQDYFEDEGDRTLGRQGGRIEEVKSLHAATLCSGSIEIGEQFRPVCGCFQFLQGALLSLMKPALDLVRDAPPAEHRVRARSEGLMAQHRASVLLGKSANSRITESAYSLVLTSISVRHVTAPACCSPYKFSIDICKYSAQFRR
jgi:hypothetical protein